MPTRSVVDRAIERRRVPTDDHFSFDIDRRHSTLWIERVHSSLGLWITIDVALEKSLVASTKPCFCSLAVATPRRGVDRDRNSFSLRRHAAFLIDHPLGSIRSGRDGHFFRT